jgi:hypothetical protein
MVTIKTQRALGDSLRFVVSSEKDINYFEKTDLSEEINKCVSVGYSAFGSIILFEKINIAKVLLQKYGIQTLMTYDKEGELPIHYIEDKKMFDLLIQYVPDLCFLQNKKGKTLDNILQEQINAIHRSRGYTVDSMIRGMVLFSEANCDYNRGSETLKQFQETIKFSSDSAISCISSEKVTFGFQPSNLFAFEASPRS